MSPTREHPRLPTLTALLLVLVALAGRALPDRAARGGAPFVPAALLADAATLASDRFEGRGAGTAGLDLAAEYVADRLRACGVAPAGDAGTYFQAFDVAGPPVVGDGTSLVFRNGAGATTIAARDWRPLPFSGGGSARGPVIDVGDALPATETVDLRSAVVLVRPRPRGPHEPAVDLRLLATAARERGAAALLVLTTTDPGDHGDSDEWNAGDAGLPVVRVRDAAIAHLLASAGLDPPTTESEAHAPPTRVAALEADVRLEPTRKRAALRNVLGEVPGTGRAGAVVLGAHYDHLGRGSGASLARDGERGAIHPGADDNASGVAVALAVACRVAAQPLDRALVVAAFSGEEIGLLGSAYYVEHPAVPLTDTLAMVNLDMVGRLRRDHAVVFGTGTASEFPALLARIASATGLHFGEQSDGIGPSDHTSFFLAGRPVLHFFTGVHEDYHRPTDRPERLNAPGMAKIASAVLGTIGVLAATDAPPSFISTTRAHREATGGYGAYLGTVPDFGRSSGGVQLAAVREGSPAEAAGLRRGDVIVGLGDVIVNDLYDLTYALRSHVAGDTVVVEYLRAGRRQRAEATLGVRP